MARAMLWPDGSCQVRCLSRLRCGSDVGGSWLAIAPSGRLKSGDEIFVSILLFGLTSPSPKSKKVCQPTNRLGARDPAAEIVRVGLALLRGVEDEGEERLAGVAGEVRAVRRPHHAVAHAIGRRLELDRDERLAAARLVDAPAPSEHVVEEPPADDLRQELVQDQPVVVPGRQPARLREDRHRVARPALRTDVVDGAVVEEQERAVEPGEDQVLVVARVADDRGAVGAARQVLEQAAALDLELDVVGGVVQLLLGDRARPVDRVEVERGRAEVARALGSRRPRPASSSRRRSCRGRGTARRTSCRPVGSGCSGCSRSARGRRSAPSARPPAGRSRRAARPACPARAAPPRPSGSAS